MARVQLLLCFAILFASVTFMEVVSAHLKIKPSLPQIEDPQTVKDVEPYTVKVVMVFVADLEKECPKTNKFKAFFERLRAFAKYVCPIGKKDEQNYDRDMKAKAGSLLQAISSFAVGKIKEEIREEIREEKEEAIQTFKWMKSVAAKILGGRKKEESEETMKLTAEQQKEIKEGILKWETVIARIAETMVQTTTTNTSEGEEGSTSGKGSPSGSDSGSGSKSSGSGSDNGSGSKSSGSGSDSGSGSKSSGGYTFGTEPTTAPGSNSGSPSGSKSSGSYSFGTQPSFKDTTGSGSNSGSPSGSPASSPSASTYGSKSGSSFKDTTGESPMSATAGPTSSGSSESASGSQSSATTVSELEAETTEEVKSFLMNLQKKCPPKEEYKSFFEKVMGTMTASAKVTAETKKGFFAGLKSAGGKISDAMSFMGSRVGSKSAEVKKSMENYHAEVVKALKELETIHSQIISQNQGKKDGSVKVTAEQRTEIKQTITKWEQVTTQFVETAIQSEASSNTTVGIDKVKLT